MSEAFLNEWHRIVAEKDLAALTALLREDVTIGAPPYWTKLEGRPLVHHLLGLILETIEGFTYYREWQQGGELALEFRGTVDGLELQGIDLISLDAGGRVANLDVLMRPTSAILALQELIGPKMLEFLTRKDPAS
jgi:hypothetical protein